MRIGLFTDTYHPQINGVVQSVDETAQALRRRGHKVYIFAPKLGDYKDTDKFVYRINSVRLIKNPEQRLAVPVPTKSFRKMLQMDLDVIHGHSGGTLCLLGYQLALVKGIPYVFTYHTLFTQYVHYIFKGKVITPAMVKSASRVFCNLTDTVIAPSGKIERELRRYGVTKPIIVVPGGIDFTKFSRKKTGFLREKLGLKKTDKILLFTGRLGKEKNLSFLITAFTKIAPTHPDTYLVIVGDGPERKHLEIVARRNKLIERVFFTGFVPREDVARSYMDSDIFVFASRTETQGLVVAEATAAGLPVVAVNDEAIAEMVTDNLNGFLTKNNPTDFSKKVILLLGDKKLRETMGEAGKKLARRTLSINDQASSLEKIYKALAKQVDNNPRQVVKITRKISAVSSFLKTARLVTLWKSFVRSFE